MDHNPAHPALMLCDWAEVINGKLYAMGAGVSQVLADQPVELALAVMLPLDAASVGVPQAVRLDLVTADGGPFFDAKGTDFALEGKLELPLEASTEGWPDRSAQVPLTVRLPPLVFPPATYRFRLFVNGTLSEVATFGAVRGTEREDDL